MAREATLEHPLLQANQAAEVAPVLPPVEAGERSTAAVELDWRQVAGAAFVLAGMVAVALAWFGVSGTLRTSSQLSYITSGGLGGGALVLLGAVCFVSREHVRDRRTIAALEARLSRLEEGLAGEFDHLYEVLGVPKGNGTAR